MMTHRNQDLHPMTHFRRSFPNFVQIILCPTTTGLRHTLGAHTIAEVLDALDLLAAHADEARAVVVSGLGGCFCAGVDLAALTHDGAAEKQRKAAEAMAAAVKRLVERMLAYPKLLVAAVNGKRCFILYLLPSFGDPLFSQAPPTVSG